MVPAQPPSSAELMTLSHLHWKMNVAQAGEEAGSRQPRFIFNFHQSFPFPIDAFLFNLQTNNIIIYIEVLACCGFAERKDSIINMLIMSLFGSRIHESHTLGLGVLFWKNLVSFNLYVI